MKNKKLIGVIALVVLVAVMAVIYVSFSEKAVSGDKYVKIQVISKSGVINNYAVDTDAEYLLGAMEETKGLTFEGEEGPYGMSISHVNGVRADYTLDGAYWGFYVNGEYCNYGVSEQPVEDGDEFKIVYTVAE